MAPYPPQNRPSQESHRQLLHQEVRGVGKLDTEGAEHGVGEPVTGRNLPLRCDEHGYAPEEEEVANVYVCDRNTSPPHETER